MGSVTFQDLSPRALLLLDSAPVIYYLEDRANFADRYEPLFRAEQAGEIRCAITPITIAEVLAGAMRGSDDLTVRRYRAILDAWEYIQISPDIAESAVRLRALHRLKLPDAFQAASALAINATLVTADRDFSRISSLRVIS